MGDTEFLIEEQVDRFWFMEENERVLTDASMTITALVTMVSQIIGYITRRFH